MRGSAGLYVTTKGTVNIVGYRKIPTISPEAYIFQRPQFEGLIFGGAYLWKENLLFKIDWASLIVGKKFTFLLCFTLYLRAISTYRPPRGLYLEGRFNGGFFTLRVWGAYIWRSLNMKGLIFGTLRPSMRCFNMSVIYMDTAQDMQPNRIRECL